MKFSMTASAVAVAATLLAATFTSPARAADSPVTEAAAPRQQTKMATCNQEAVGKKGDERKAFMKQCLSSGKAHGDAVSTAQTDRAKACKVDAKGMRGNARKDFIKECLSKAA